MQTEWYSLIIVFYTCTCSIVRCLFAASSLYRNCSCGRLAPTFHHVTSEAGSEDHFSRQWCLRGQQFDQTMSWKQRRCGCLVVCHVVMVGECVAWDFHMATWDDMWQVGMVKGHSLARKSPWGLYWSIHPNDDVDMGLIRLFHPTKTSLWSKH